MTSNQAFPEYNKLPTEMKVDVWRHHFLGEKNPRLVVFGHKLVKWVNGKSEYEYECLNEDEIRVMDLLPVRTSVCYQGFKAAAESITLPKILHQSANLSSDIFFFRGYHLAHAGETFNNSKYAEDFNEIRVLLVDERDTLPSAGDVVLPKKLEHYILLVGIRSDLTPVRTGFKRCNISQLDIHDHPDGLKDLSKTVDAYLWNAWRRLREQKNFFPDNCKLSVAQWINLPPGEENSEETVGSAPLPPMVGSMSR